MPADVVGDVFSDDRWVLATACSHHSLPALSELHNHLPAISCSDDQGGCGRSLSRPGSAAISRKCDARSAAQETRHSAEQSTEAASH